MAWQVRKGMHAAEEPTAGVRAYAGGKAIQSHFDATISRSKKQALLLNLNEPCPAPQSSQKGCTRSGTRQC